MRDKFFNTELRDLFTEGRFAEAISRCQSLLDRVRLSNGEQHIDVPLLLDDLAHAYYKSGDYQSALRVKTEILKLDASHYGEESEDYIRGLSDIGLLYYYVGKSAESDVALDRALELVQRLPLDNKCDRAQILINKSYLKMDRQEYREAEQLLLEAARLRKVDHGSAYLGFANVYDHLSRLYRKMGRAGAAVRAIEKAIRIFRNEPPLDQLRYARMLEMLGVMLAEQGRALDAKASFLEAADVLQQIYCEDSALKSRVKHALSNP